MSQADRRAALEVHRLAPTDREWLLGQLGAAERARMTRLLAELDAMDIRIDVDANWLAEAMPADPHPGAPVNGRGAGSGPDIVRHAPAAAIAAALENEPAWVIDAVMAIEPWTWADEVAAQLARRRGPALRRSTRAPGDTPPALAGALVAAIAAHLARQGPVAPDGGPAAGRTNGHALNGRGGFGGLFSGVRKWLP